MVDEELVARRRFDRSRDALAAALAVQERAQDEDVERALEELDAVRVFVGFG